MSEESGRKKLPSWLNWAIIIGVIAYIGVRYGDDFIDGYNAGTPSETERLIEQGAFAFEAELMLEDPKMPIKVRTVLPHSKMMQAMQPGDYQDRVIAFMSDEADKILEACDAFEGEAARPCVEKLDFTLPPYPGD